MTAPVASALVKRAWAVRPTSLESAIALIVIGAAGVLLGLPVWKALLFLGLLVTVLCPLTAWEELRETQPEPAGVQPGPGEGDANL